MTDESRTGDLLRAWMDANRLNWDDRVAVHLRNRTSFYPIDRVRPGHRPTLAMRHRSPIPVAMNGAIPSATSLVVY